MTDPSPRRDRRAEALVAPAAAAAIFAGFGLVPVFYLDVVTAVVGIGFLVLVTVPPLVRTSAVASCREDLVEGRIGLILVATYSFAALTVGLGLSPNLWIFYGFMFIFGMVVPLFSTPVTTLMQQIVPQEKQGRVFSYYGIVMALATPIGVVVFGPLADVVSVQALLVGGGLVTVAVMTVAVLLPSGRAAIAAAQETTPSVD